MPPNPPKTRRGRPNKRAVTRRNLNKVYTGISGYGGNTAGLDPRFPTTYGEVKVESIEKLVEFFQSASPARAGRAFYDLGSGAGKVVLGVAHLVPGLKARGVELVPTRHDLAVLALSRLEDPRVKSRVEFTCGSMMDTALADAQWIYLSNLCFSAELNKEIAEKIGREVVAGTVLVCSSELPLDLTQFERLPDRNLPMTWSDTSTVRVYRRR
jgi:Histone methylation protein DOT1